MRSALNLANSLGAALGGLVIAAGFGYLAPSWVGVGLGLLGLALTLVSFRSEHRTGARRAAAVNELGHDGRELAHL